MLKKLLVVILILPVLFVFKNDKAYAGTLTNLSDTLTTSRPSAATPLSVNAASSATSLTIYNNGSRFLASDSAKIMRTSTGLDVVSSTTIATQSSALTTAYTTSGISSAAQNGTDVLITNISAMHTVSFITANPVPVGGKIVITFPGSGLNTATPSASTFSFNGLTSGNAAANITYKLNSGGTATCTSFTVSAPSITCTTTGAVINAGQSVTFLIGCADAGTNSATCSSQSPRLINPTKSAAAGTADVWNVSVQTQDSGSVSIDNGLTKAGTIDTVQVQASVDATFSFTIAGIANAAAVNTGNTTGCTNSEVTNTGIAASTTNINLGALPVAAASTPNISAQLMTIATNASNGYTLTATSSGQLIDDSTGFWINSSTTPAVFPATAPWFGIHACGLDINTSTWGAVSTTTTRGGTAKYGWPTQTTAVTLATDSIGPIVNGSTGNGLTTVEYAAAVDTSVPSGTYVSEITYVASPVF